MIVRFLASPTKNIIIIIIKFCVIFMTIAININFDYTQNRVKILLSATMNYRTVLRNARVSLGVMTNAVM